MGLLSFPLSFCRKSVFASSIAAFHDFRSSTVSNANQYTFLLFYALTLHNK